MASSGDLTEEEVKKYIKGILTSNPLVSTIQTMEKDYRDLIGTSIPFHKFKYNSVEHFLKSIPDTCVVQGTGSLAQVTPVVSEKSAHIDKLVTQQKVNVKGRRKPMGPRRNPNRRHRTASIPLQATGKTAGASKTQNTTRSAVSTPQKSQIKKPRGERTTKPATTTSLSFKAAASSEKVAIVGEGYPEAQMTTEMMEDVKTAILSAYDNIPDNFPQVRFENCNHRSGYLEVTCSDKISTEWLLKTVPTLKPWESAVLKALTGKDLPKPVTCTVFVPDQFGERLPAERILKRLSVGNRGLKASLWKSWGAISMDKGQVWTFSMDEQSLEILEQANMSPHFGFGRIKFRRKQDKKSEDKVQQTADDSKASTSKADVTHRSILHK